MRTETHMYREYELQLVLNAPVWQATVYATRPGMPAITWETKPIWAANVMGALTAAKIRIDEALAS
jgi:hypothetical protein